MNVQPNEQSHGPGILFIRTMCKTQLEVKIKWGEQSITSETLGSQTSALPRCKRIAPDSNRTTEASIHRHNRTAEAKSSLPHCRGIIPPQLQRCRGVASVPPCRCLAAPKTRNYCKSLPNQTTTTSHSAGTFQWSILSTLLNIPLTQDFHPGINNQVWYAGTREIITS